MQLIILTHIKSYFIEKESKLKKAEKKKGKQRNEKSQYLHITSPKITKKIII